MFWRYDHKKVGSLHERWEIYRLLCVMLVFKLLYDVEEKISAGFGHKVHVQQLAQLTDSGEKHCKKKKGERDKYLILYWKVIHWRSVLYIRSNIIGHNLKFIIFLRWATRGSSGRLMESMSTLKEALVTTSKLYGPKNLQHTDVSIGLVIKFYICKAKETPEKKMTLSSWWTDGSLIYTLFDVHGLVQVLCGQTLHQSFCRLSDHGEHLQTTPKSSWLITIIEKCLFVCFLLTLHSCSFTILFFYLDSFILIILIKLVFSKHDTNCNTSPPHPPTLLDYSTSLSVGTFSHQTFEFFFSLSLSDKKFLQLYVVFLVLLWLYCHNTTTLFRHGTTFRLATWI